MEVRIGQEPDGSYIAYNIDGEKTVLLGTGDAIEEAKEDFFNSIEEVKQSYIDLGESIPEELFEEVHFAMEDEEFLKAAEKIGQSKPLPSEFSKIIDDNFWELF